MNIDVLIPIASESRYVRDAACSAIRNSDNANVYLIENNVGNKEYSKYLMELAEELSIQYVYFDERLPMFENWQRCMSVGEAEWAAFLHDDDIWSAGYLNIVSGLEDTADIIFFEYKHYDKVGMEEALKLDRFPCHHELEVVPKRAVLLARMLYTNQHVSSTAFRRKVNLEFPSGFRMFGDQHAFRECVAKHENIKVAWVHSEHPNMIRMHSGQITWNGALKYTAVENARSYRSYVRLLDKQRFDVGAFCEDLKGNCTDEGLCRFVSAIIMRKPYALSTSLAINVLDRKPLKLWAGTMVRALIQEMVWKLKISVARYRSGKHGL